MFDVRLGGAGRVKRPLGPSEARFTLSCLSGVNGRSGGETEFTQKLTDGAGCAGGGCLDPGLALGRAALPPAGKLLVWGPR